MLALVLVTHRYVTSIENIGTDTRQRTRLTKPQALTVTNASKTIQSTLTQFISPRTLPLFLRIPIPPYAVHEARRGNSASRQMSFQLPLPDSTRDLDAARHVSVMLLSVVPVVH